MYLFGGTIWARGALAAAPLCEAKAIGFEFLITHPEGADYVQILRIRRDDRLGTLAVRRSHSRPNPDATRDATPDATPGTAADPAYPLQGAHCARQRGPRGGPA